MDDLLMNYNGVDKPVENQNEFKKEIELYKHFKAGLSQGRKEQMEDDVCVLKTAIENYEKSVKDSEIVKFVGDEIVKVLKEAINRIKEVTDGRRKTNKSKSHEISRIKSIPRQNNR
jgi:hypothetical protein